MPRWKLDRRKAFQLIKQYLVMLLITFKWIFILCFIVGLFGGAAVFGYVTSLVKDEPIRDKATIYSEMQKNTLTGFVYFNDGTLVGQLRGIDRRLVDRLEDVPQSVQDAFLAVEDSDFYNHIGVNFTSLMRAVKERVFNEDKQTGGSTITQQLARNVFLSLDRTDTRKVKEIFLAIRLERVLSKDEIFLAYLNKVPFGNGSSGYNVYGIKAAAEGIFNLESLDDIHIAQAAYLAGLPKNPTDYSAFDGYGRFDEDGFQKALDRQKLVLRRMYLTGKITADEYDKALKFDIRATLAEPKAKAYSTYPFLMIEAEKKAAETLLKLDNPDWTEQDFRKSENAQLISNAREDLLGKGYKIYTTIDKDLYDAMQAIASNPENFTPDHETKGIEQVGAIAIDNSTGAILGMIEGRDFYQEQLNHATQMIRQPGSTMKPIAAYLPAMENGDIQPASIIDDSPMILEDGGKGYHLPNNWNFRFHGLITARHALNQSYNIPALYLFNEVVTIPQAWEFTKQLGITTLTENDNYARTGVIGGLEYGTTVEELTNAFAAIPNKGAFLDSYMIERIEDSEGNIIYEHQPEPKQVFSEETAFLMTDMLRTVIQSGTGVTVKSSFKHYNEIQVAGKTGSTQRDQDMWFIGFSPQITVGVWTGYDQPATIEYNHGASHRAKNIWSMIMDEAISLKPDYFAEKQFEQPKDVVRMTVSSASGLLPSPLAKETGRLTTDWFNRKWVPTKEDDALQSYAYVRYKGVNYLPNSSTPGDMIREKVLIRRELNIFEQLQRIDQILKELPAQARPKRNNRDMRVEDYYPLDLAMTAPMVELPDIPDDGPPEPPTGITATKDGNTYVIEFQPSASEDVIGYRIYRSTGDAFTKYAGIGFGPGDHMAFYQQTNPLMSYAWYLTAVDIHGNESRPSDMVYSNQDGDGLPLLPIPEEFPKPGDQDDDGNEDQGSEGQDQSSVPAAPQNVQVTGTAEGLSVDISWQANAAVDSVSHYEIYYSSSADGEYSKIGTSNSTRFNYISLPIEGWYRIVAVNSFGNSSPSEAVHYGGTTES